MNNPYNNNPLGTDKIILNCPATIISKRWDRIKKIKKILNYDKEMNFLYEYRDFCDDKTIEEFKILVKKTLIESEQISTIIFEIFYEELLLKEELKKLEEETEKMTKRMNEINNIFEPEELDESDKLLGTELDDFFPMELT